MVNFAWSCLDSRDSGKDTILRFQAIDRIDLDSGVAGWTASVTGGALSDASFEADLQAALNAALGPNQAVAFRPDAGDHAGKLFVVVDANGDGDYTNGADYVLEFQDPLTPIDGGTFFI